MYVITVEFTIVPAHIDEFMDAVQQQAENSLQREPGCHQFDIARGESDAYRIFLYEVYTDRAAFDLHMESSYFKSFNERATPWIADKTVNGWIQSTPS